MLGQTILTTTTAGTGIHQDIDLSSFTKGLYLLTVRDADGASGTRVIAKD